MSIEKVRRYNLNQYCMMESSDTGRYIEYADVTGLVEAVKALLPFCVTDVLEHCDGNKCRESWCAGCLGDSEAANAVVRSNAAQANARNELARWQS